MANEGAEDYRPDLREIEEYEKLSKQVKAEKKRALINGNSNGNGKATSSNKSKQRKPTTTTKSESNQEFKKQLFVERYAIDGSIAEAVIIAGRPKFAVAVPKTASPNEVSIILHDVIETDDAIIRPLESKDYMSKAYKFSSVEDFQQLVVTVNK